MPNPNESMLQNEIRNGSVKSREALLEDIKQQRPLFQKEFDRQFKRQFLDDVDVPFQDENNKGRFLTVNDISELDTNGSGHGYSKSEINSFKATVKDIEVHDLRGENLTDAQKYALRATEYKKYFEQNIDKKINECIEKIERVKEATEELLEYENKRAPLYEQIAKRESEIVNLEMEPSLSKEEKEKLANLKTEKAKLQKEFDNFFASSSQTQYEYNVTKNNLQIAKDDCDRTISMLNRMTNSAENNYKINKVFYDGFIKYEKRASEMDEFINAAVDEWTKKDNEAKKQEEARKAAEKEAEIQKEKDKVEADKAAALKEEIRISKEEDQRGYYSDQTINKLASTLEKTGEYAESFSKLKNAPAAMLTDENDKKEYEKYSAEIEGLYSEKQKSHEIEFEKSYLEGTADKYNEGKQLFDRSSRIENKSGLEIEEKYNRIQESVKYNVFKSNAGSFDTLDYARSVGFTHSVNRYFNNLAEPSKYNGPDKANYTYFYNELAKNVSIFNDKVNGVATNTKSSQALMYAISSKQESKKDLDMGLLNSAILDHQTFGDKSASNTLSKIRTEDRSYLGKKKRLYGDQARCYIDAYRQIKNGEKNDFINSLPEKTKEASKERTSLAKANNTYKEEQKRTKGKVELLNYTQEAEKYNNKNWFSKLFSRGTKTALDRQRQTLKREFGYSDVQLDVAQYGSKLNAKQFTKIIGKTERTLENAKFFAEIMKSFNFNNKKLSNTFNEFVRDFNMADEPIKNEPTQENRKQIILEEVKDAPQQAMQNDLENSKSLDLEKSIEIDAIKSNK